MEKGLRGLKGLLAAMLMILLMANSAGAFDFNLKGSLGESGHKRYVPPLANPLFNETPYITTEARPIYLYSQIPSTFPSQGGHINLYALELRLALTDRLGFIASKDGFANADFSRALDDVDGFANISAGLKYALINKPSEDFIVSAGAEYELPVGDLESSGIELNKGGSGFLDLFLTGAKAYGKLGLQGSLGANLAMDGDHDSSIFHYSAHIDYEVLPKLFPMIELNGLSNMDEGSRTGLTAEGNDILNFGASSSGHVASLAAGARYRLTDHVLMGAGYEFPITARQDLVDWRINADLVIYY